jgi:hypothetical protein
MIEVPTRCSPAARFGSGRDCDEYPSAVSAGGDCDGHPPAVTPGGDGERVPPAVMPGLDPSICRNVRDHRPGAVRVGRDPRVEPEDDGVGDPPAVMIRPEADGGRHAPAAITHFRAQTDARSHQPSVIS